MDKATKFNENDLVIFYDASKQNVDADPIKLTSSISTALIKHYKQRS
ncbi:10300_t:CDS:2 [Diversispora eburnea]|uniref:10300_t:CDS:1 n=1 Tax=Diversispora eburnea TaxID=1213867 RepID=A0A9N8VBA0_9GLOM|nr:10300_t:CDS:2 [Diversispora eburnea]